MEIRRRQPFMVLQARGGRWGGGEQGCCWGGQLFEGGSQHLLVGFEGSWVVLLGRPGPGGVGGGCRGRSVDERIQMNMSLLVVD